MEENSKLACSEVYEILNLLEDEYISKIPERIINFFKEERDLDYEPKINVNIPLYEQNLKRETMIFLTILNLNYWCDSENEKEEILTALSKNDELEKKEQEEVQERYNPDNIFKKKNELKEQITDNSENMQLIEYKEQGFIKKLLHKIMSFFKSKKE